MAVTRSGRTGHRVLLFAVVLGVYVAFAVLAASQDDWVDGWVMLGTVVLAGTLWFVAWRRGAWHLHHGNAALALYLTGVVVVAGFGTLAVSDTVLSVRGESVAVTVLDLGPADANGDRTYALFRASDEFLLPDDLVTDHPLDEDDIRTVRVDPEGFVSPKLPEDMNTTTSVLFALGGVVSLAIAVLGLGFPFGPGRRERT